MNKRLVGVIAFAVVVALGASIVVYQLLARRLGVAGPSKTTTVLVASRDLPIGYVAKLEDVEAVTWGGPPPPGSILKPEDVAGRGSIMQTLRGEPLLESHFAAKGAGAGLAVTIPPGKRAVAVKVNEVVGLAGFILPGMKVDVIACGESPTDRERNLGTQARTLLQNVDVLSAGQNIQRDTDGKPITVQVVNLLVTPEEAEVLSLAGNETKIQLVLRNPLDQEKIKTPGTAQAFLFAGRPSGIPAPTAPKGVSRPKPPEPKVQKVVVPVMMEIISGAKREDVKVGSVVEERVVSEGKKQ
jgi:pilus assembly protein CpaB